MNANNSKTGTTSAEACTQQQTDTSLSSSMSISPPKKRKSSSQLFDLSNHKHNEWACTANGQDLPEEEDESGGFGYFFRVVSSNAIIWVVPLLIFAALTISGVTIVCMHFDNQSETRVEAALSVASETGKRFSDFLDNSITPLFSLAQFVHELDEFRDLPDQIGPIQNQDSLPMVINSTSHRNISGVCDDPHLTDRFHSIAGTIKENAKQMQGVLVNLQLVPEGVVCLLHPVVNTEDFPPGKALNNTGAIGHDLIADPRRRFHAEESLKQGDLVIVGPIQLVQCQGCDPIVEQAFIARLPIIMEGHDVITYDGQKIQKRWGFAVALINWQVLVEKTYLYEDFAVRGWGFKLTRIDRTYDDETQAYNTKTVVLAETPDFEDKASQPNQYQVVQTNLDTTDDEWTIQVVYSVENAPAWKIASIVLIVVVTALISFLAFVVLFQKQVHSELVKANLVRAELSARAERDLNDFIAHEIRNPLSAAMSAGTFLATTVEEEQQKFKQRQLQQLNASSDEERQSLLSWSSSDVHQTIKEDVGIINSSLHFINDLLRNLLDIHRAASRQLVLDPSETDLLTDVLEPVAAMLQHRDRDFAIEIQVDKGSPNPFIIQVDRLRLQQVILNLGRNSAKFVTDGKQAFVRLRARLIEEDGSVELSVEDSGSGIPVSKRRNLFARFQESLDSLSQGTGVGLNLCKTLVELMGGELSLDESYDSGVEGFPGARFVVHLKASRVLPPAPPSVEFYVDEDQEGVDDPDESMMAGSNKPLDASAKQSNDGKLMPDEADVEMGCGKPDPCNLEESSRRARGTAMDRSECLVELPQKLTVLFADDERVLRKLALRAFSKLAPGWTVEETASGEAALQMVVDKHYDMVFLDQYFTSVERRLTGTETARAMRAKGVKSIICGVSANDIEGAFLKAGADVFTTKPFATNQKQLKAFMLRALQKKR